jgi:hypothetical protein
MKCLRKFSRDKLKETQCCFNEVVRLKRILFGECCHKSDFKGCKKSLEISVQDEAMNSYCANDFSSVTYE